jgi:hypothetical protein
VLIALVIGGVVGFIFYLNGLFSTDYSPDRATTRGRRQ